MNIDVVGRIRPSVRGEGPCRLEIDGPNRIASRPGGAYFSFQHLHHQDASNYDIFKKSVESLLDLCISGFNTSLIVAGESGSGKSYTVAGESLSKAGVVPMLIEHLFSKIVSDTSYMYDTKIPAQHKVHMKMYEIYNELIRDLLQIPGIHTEFLDTDETPENGPIVRGLASLPLPNATEGVTLFRQAWSRRTENPTDYGSTKQHSTVVIQFELILQTGESPKPNKTKFTIVVTPGAEKLVDDSSQIRMKEGPTLSKSFLALTHLVADLSNKPYPDRVINYSDSKLTHLLKDEIGGNCKTRLLVTLKPDPAPPVLAAILRLATQFAQVKNFPILNDPFAQQLMTQNRARILNLIHQLGLGGGMANTFQHHNVEAELKKLQEENLQLRDKNEGLHLQLDQLQGKFGTLATTKSDLSTQLLMTEEEKLKVSRSLVDMQIENNRLKEEAEAAQFELTNKIIQLEDEALETAMAKEKYEKSARLAKERMTEADKERRELADEYVALKENYLGLKEFHEREVEKNEELCIELLNLANAKAVMMKELLRFDSDAYGDPNLEVSRIKDLVSRLSSRKRHGDDFLSRDERTRKYLFGNEDRFRGDMERLQKQFDEDQLKLEGKMGSIKKEHQDLRHLVREKQRLISELNAELIVVKGQRDHLNSQNNRMQHKMKDVNEDFRSRLMKYIEDIANFVDRGGAATGKTKPKIEKEKMRNYVDKMLKDLNRGHKAREEQLSHAAQGYKTRMEEVLRKYEEILVAYRMLNQRIMDRGLEDIEPGPDEHGFMITDKSLLSEQQKEINRLREDLQQAKHDYELLKLNMRSKNAGPDFKGTDSNSDYLSTLRKELREYTMNTQQELETERAELMTKCAMLEQENKSLNDYIETHLTSYRDQVIKAKDRPNGYPAMLHKPRRS